MVFVLVSLYSRLAPNFRTASDDNFSIIISSRLIVLSISAVGYNHVTEIRSIQPTNTLCYILFPLKEKKNNYASQKLYGFVHLAKLHLISVLADVWLNTKQNNLLSTEYSLISAALASKKDLLPLELAVRSYKYNC